MRAGLTRILLPARNAETLAWRAVVTADGGAVSNQRILIVDKLISNLKSSGQWTTQDEIFLYAAENSQQALRGIKARTLASLVNAPTFSANNGYTTAGTNDYVDTNVNSSTTTQYTQDSGAFSVWSLTNATNANSFGGEFDGTDGTTINGLDGSNNATFRVNTASASNITGSSPSGIGFFTASRTGANQLDGYRNASSLATSAATASIAVNNLTFKLGTSNVSTFRGFTFACAIIGAGRGSAAETNVYNAIRTWAAAIGIP